MKLQQHEAVLIDRQKVDKITFIGSGFGSVAAALMLELTYRIRGENIRITLLGDQDPTKSPASNLCPSVSAQEILAVMPSPAEAREFLGLLYNEPGGLAASLEHLQTPKAKAFIAELYDLATDPQKIADDQLILTKYGEFCMLVWARVVELARELDDEELIDILINKSSLRLPAGPGEEDNGDNHRVDIYINTPNAVLKTNALVDSMRQLGSIHSKVLSPAEYLSYFPDSHEFVRNCTFEDRQSKELKWCDEVSVARRPGGRINPNQFMKHIMQYLAKRCYINEKGEEKSYVRFHERKVKKLVCDPGTDSSSQSIKVVDLEMMNPKTSELVETNRKDSHYRNHFYIFNPGSRVDSAEELGIQVPRSALLAGMFMKINIPKNQLLPTEQNINTHLGLRNGNGVGGIETSVVQIYPDPNNSMNFVVHVAGIKIFCGDTEPAREGTLNPFAYHRLLLQFNMLLTTFPNLLKPICNHLGNKSPTVEDLILLQEQKIIEMGVECRAVSTTNVSYISTAHLENGQIAENVGVCTAPSSAGVAFALGNACGVIEAATKLGINLFPETRRKMGDVVDKIYARMAENNLPTSERVQLTVSPR